jgi:hypothetical protein
MPTVPIPNDLESDIDEFELGHHERDIGPYRGGVVAEEILGHPHAQCSVMHHDGRLVDDAQAAIGRNRSQALHGILRRVAAGLARRLPDHFGGVVVEHPRRPAGIPLVIEALQHGAVL